MSAIAPLEMTFLPQPRTKIEHLIKANFCAEGIDTYHPYRTTTATVLTASVGIATLLAIPAQLPVCVKVAEGNLALQYVLGGASILGNFRNTAKPYAAIRLSQSIIMSLSSAESGSQKSYALPLRVAHVALSVIMGGAAQIPFVLILLHLGESPALAYMTLSEAVLPMYSTYRSFDGWRTGLAACLKDRLALVKNEVVSSLHYRLTCFRQNASYRADTLDFLDKMKTSSDPIATKVAHFFTYLIKDAAPAEENIRIKKITAVCLGVILTLAQLYFTWVPTDVGFEKAIPTPSDRRAFDAFVTFCNLSLLKTLLMDTSLQALTGLANFSQKPGSEMYIGETLAPKASFALKIFCQILCPLVGWTASWAVAESYVGKNTQGRLAGTILGVSQVFLSYIAARFLSEYGLENFLSRWGSDEQKKALEAYQNLRELTDFIEASSPESLGEFLLDLEPSARITALLEKFHLNHELLKEIFPQRG